MSLAIGDTAPQFALPGTDGQTHAYKVGNATATVVIFTCNHCPYALSWEDRLHDVARDYSERGVRLLAINPNDARRKPADSFNEMKRRVTENPWPLPYLRDEDQSVAAAYDAQTTPDVFVFDADDKLVYRGAPDSDYETESLNAQWLRGALDAVLAGQTPDPAQTKPVGCSIKWKQ